MGTNLKATLSPVSKLNATLTPGAATGAPQTPWLSDIDGANYSLRNARHITVGPPLPAYGDQAALVVTPDGTRDYTALRVTGYDPAQFASNIAFWSRPDSQDIWYIGVDQFVNGVRNLQFKYNGPGGGGGIALTLAANSYVGISQQSPQYPLDVLGASYFNGHLTVNATVESLVGGFKFPDGTTQTTAVTAVPQTPWASNIDAAGFNLSNAGDITMNVGKSLTASYVNIPDGLGGSFQPWSLYASSGALNFQYGGSNWLSFDGVNQVFGVGGIVQASGGIKFGDGTLQTTAATGSGGGGSQTPWTSDIDGGGHYLSNVSSIYCGQLNTNYCMMENPQVTDQDSVVTWNWSFIHHSGVLNIVPTGDWTTMQTLDANKHIITLCYPTTVNNTTDPAYALDVTGDCNVTGQFLVGGSPTDPTTTKGDLIVRGMAAVCSRLGVGADGTVLTAEAAQPLGMHWAAPAAGGGGSQTPWASDIDGANFNLLNPNSVLIGSSLNEGVFLSVYGYPNPPAITGTTQTGIARFCAYKGGPGVGSGNTLDIGGYSGSPYGIWMQVTDRFALASTYPIILQPNGGYVGVAGNTNPAYAIDVIGDVNVTGQYRVNGTRMAMVTLDAGAQELVIQFDNSTVRLPIPEGRITYS